jgi:Inner membrane protein YgaP-like, transmembrane domain
MQLKTNESTLDRAIRIVLGIALLGIAAVGTVAAPWVYLAGLVGAIALVTGAVGFCPLYAVLRVGTKSSAH